MNIRQRKTGFTVYRKSSKSGSWLLITKQSTYICLPHQFLINNLGFSTFFHNLRYHSLYCIRYFCNGFSAKQAFLQWCYNNQDQATGLWGPRSRGSYTLLNGGDITDSEKMIKLFLDYTGAEIYPEFPLRYREVMFASALKKLSRPMPDDLDELHDWILSQDRGLRFLTRYLWNNASQAEKKAAGW